ncbi:MAG: hypothetical protein ACE5H0_11915 [Bacteroidota bacterium]
MEPRRAVVQYTLQSHPFAIEIPEISLPAEPKDHELRQQAEAMLSKIRWCAHEVEATPGAAAKMVAPDDLAGDALLVMTRICEAPAETIEQRCEALRMDRAREFRARALLDTRGLVRQVEQTVGGKVKFFQLTDKGIDWAQKRNIRVKKFKSGIIHEYLLCQMEKRIGFIGAKWRLQRNSSIARDQGLQPDLLVMGPDGQRIIVEVCCSNLDYDAGNILIEARIPDIDLVLAITPDSKTRKALQRAFEKNPEYSTEVAEQSIRLLDAGQCLAEEFDWTTVLAGKT